MSDTQARASDAPARARPRAFRLDGDLVVETAPDPYEREAARALAPRGAAPSGELAIEAAQDQGVAPRRGWSWGGLFWSALSALVALALGVWVDGIIASLFARAQALGWIAVALAALVLLALGAMLWREMRGLFKQRRIATLHQAFAAARIADDRDAARRLTHELVALYESRPQSAAARAHVVSLTREIVDGRDLIDIAERDLALPLDVIARREIAIAARRVSLITTISPRALIDVLFVAAQSIRLVRRIAEVYGGRPGFLGLVRIARSVGAHLAITGGMAVGDSIVQQALGHGVAAKLSARLGEGVLNGMLTTRVGLSALAVCRPMPFALAPAPGVKDVAPFLFQGDKGEDQRA